MLLFGLYLHFIIMIYISKVRVYDSTISQTFNNYIAIALIKGNTQIVNAGITKFNNSMVHMHLSKGTFPPMKKLVLIPKPNSPTPHPALIPFRV